MIVRPWIGDAEADRDLIEEAGIVAGDVRGVEIGAGMEDQFQMPGRGRPLGMMGAGAAVRIGDDGARTNRRSAPSSRKSSMRRPRPGSARGVENMRRHVACRHPETPLLSRLGACPAPGGRAPAGPRPQVFQDELVRQGQSSALGSVAESDGLSQDGSDR